MEPIAPPRLSPRMPLTATYAMPGYLLATYALLLLSLGWFAHQRWIEKAHERCATNERSTAAQRNPTKRKYAAPGASRSRNPSVGTESRSIPAPNGSPKTG